MDDEIRLVSDGDVIGVVGDQEAVRALLKSEGLWKASQKMRLALRPSLDVLSMLGEAGSEIAANSCRWLKVTEQSAAFIKKYGLRKASKSGLSTGVVLGQKGGQIGGFVEFTKGPRLLLNPATLSSVAGLIGQLALQQSLAEITDYLERIDKKVTEVLANQKDDELAAVLGAGRVVHRAMGIWDGEHDVPATLWSTVQDQTGAVAISHERAILRLRRLAERLDSASSVRELVNATKVCEQEAQEMFAVLAYCLQVQDHIDILELDMVRQQSPASLARYRLGQKQERQVRIDQIANATEHLRFDAPVRVANDRLLLHPNASPGVVARVTRVEGQIVEFRGALGLVTDRPARQIRPWTDAFSDVLDTAGPLAGGLVAGVGAAVVITKGRRG